MTAETSQATAPRQGEATVRTTTAGAPESLVWRGRRFDVIARPIPWIDRVPWWKTTARAPLGAGPLVLEQKMWQVQAAAADDGEILIFDLAAGPGPQWPVTAIFD